MSASSSIEWTEATWNPVRGCTKISPGCKHCYAETFAERFRGVRGHAYEQGFDIRLVPEVLPLPLTWEKSRAVFVNSMSDLFEQRVPSRYIEHVVHVMRIAGWHEFQVLTKRAERLEAFSHANGLLDIGNVIWGVSVEDRTYGVPRIEHLRRARVLQRFLSIEPLLEDLGELDLADIDWVIVGGESGAGARPIEPGWVRRIRDMCAEQHVPFFFKQWGGTRKKLRGRKLDNRTHDERPVISRGPVPSRVNRHAMIRDVERLAADDDPAFVLLDKVAGGRLPIVGAVSP